MKVSKLNEFTKGWVIGNFIPSLSATTDFEVAVKRYNAGDEEKAHHHKIATEHTIIIQGSVIMNSQVYFENDIITIEPNETTDFNCLTDVITVVIKTPSVNGDKY